MKILKIINFSLVFSLFCLLVSCASGGGGGGAVAPVVSSGAGQVLGGGAVGGDSNIGAPQITDAHIDSANHAAPAADSGTVAPVPDFVPPWVITLQCNLSSCAVIDLGGDLPGNQSNASNDTRICYKFTARMAPALNPDANYPGLDNMIVRFVDTEHQRYEDFQTEDVGGWHGTFMANISTDSTPHFVYYIAPPGFVPTSLGVMQACNGSCTPPNWENADPLYPNDSCSFLQSPEQTISRRPSVPGSLGPMIKVNSH